MDVWDWLWWAWIAMFVIVEWRAIVNSTEGDTLSEHFRKWFNTERKRGKWIFLIVWSVFAGWFTVHIIAGG